MKIPLSSPDITESEIEAVTAVLRSSHLSLGPQLDAFEAAFTAYVGVPHAVAVSSGTAGLHLCMRALDLGEGDEVIVPSFTFIAAANVIRYVGAIPVFIDIDEASLNMSPASVEAAITPRSRAILIVHTFGRPSEMDELLAIARQHKLAVVEDACEAIGAEYHGQRVGSFGDAAVFGFYPNKQMTTGEGGIIVTRDAAMAKRMRALRNQGRYASENWFQHEELGYNYRLSEMNCALGLAQLQRIEPILERREQIARRYDALLTGVPGVVLPSIDVPRARVSWFVYVVRIDVMLPAAARELIVQELQQAGVQCGRYFAPIHQQPSYAAWRQTSSLHITEAQARRTIALPFFNQITDEQITFVCAALCAALLKAQND